LQMPFET